MRCQRSLLVRDGGRRASVAVASCGGRYGAGDGALGGAGSGGGAGGAVVKFTRIVTGGGDLRRDTLWSCRSADLVRNGCLDIKEECPAAMTREWANVSSDELILWSARFARNGLVVPGCFTEKKRRLGCSGFQQQQSCREHTDRS